MGAIKNYFKRQFQISMFFLEHESPSDFYLSFVQKNQSPLPLMLVRGFLFLGCVGIVVASLAMTGALMSLRFWPIYLTHWGLVLITLSCGFGFAVSATAYFDRQVDPAFGLPWHYKAYWVLYSLSVPVAFFITVFYWSFLTNDNQEFAPNWALDVFIHAMNSVIMLVLLASARQPTFVLHFYWCCLLAVAYVVFTLVYYYSGGTDPLGNAFIYPVLDWSNPGSSVLTVAFAVVLVLLLHLLCALLAVGRDAAGRAIGKDNNTFVLSN